MGNRGSLKNQVNDFGRGKFKGVFPSWVSRYGYSFFRKVATDKGGLAVVPFVVLFFFIGQLPAPKFLQIVSMPDDTARLIIDQRSANLATIFSITLVVIGWLITNLAVKETVSYRFLFKRTFLYPIFYFIITLIGCIMLCSLLRHQGWMDIGKAVISATYLILIALALITFLFFRLITVVGTNFFYASLEKEVIDEASRSARKLIIERKSNKLYHQFCTTLGFEDKIAFGTVLAHHSGINITPYTDNRPVDIHDIFAARKKYRIKDINLTKITEKVGSIQLAGSNYFRPVSISSVINENFYPFYFHTDSGDVSKIRKGITKAFKLAKRIKETNESHVNLDFLCERFEKDVKEGKKENVEMALAIFAKVFKLENQIVKEC